MIVNRLLLMSMLLVFSTPISSLTALAEQASESKQKPSASDDQKSAPEQQKKGEDESILYLESTLVGDKEQPTVSYFIPWKGTGTPDNLHWNIEQKNDQTLNVLDREIMLRSMSVYNELNMENTAKQ